MRGKLPPLFTLQAFEAAARLESFSRAASELSLTPGAISRQIRQLEDWSSLTLFERHGPRVMLTGDGVALLARMQEPLTLLHQAIYPRTDDAPKILQIATIASIAKEWLVPRLHDFRHRHPNIRLVVQSGYDLVRAAPRVPMVAIRHARPSPKDPSSETLFDDRLIAVCSPRLRKTLGREPGGWPPTAVMQHLSLDAGDWYRAAGMSQEFSPQGLAFNDADVLLEAAQGGLGIALTRLSIAWRRLQVGELVLACATVCVAQRANLLVVREDCGLLPEVQAFSEWLRQQASDWQAVQALFDKRMATCGDLDEAIGAGGQVPAAD